MQNIQESELNDFNKYFFVKLCIRLYFIGVNVLPESAILVLVWETLAMHIGKSYKGQSVVFRYIQFHSELILRKDVPLRLCIAINRGSNKFEVSAIGA